MIDFWFAIGSTYTYLAVMRVDTVAQASGVEVRWRPFNIRQVLIAYDNDPFGDKPVKEAYMWRDVARQAEALDLSPALPAPYPLPDSPFANQVAVLGAEEGWLKDYAKATYRRWFERGEYAGEDPNLSASLAEIGQDPERVLAEARSERVVRAMDAATREAMKLGIFGAPTFAVGRELFWGNDRLEDAISWARTGSLATRG